MSTGSEAIDWKLQVKTLDTKWTKLAKRVINGLMDYAAEMNKSDSCPRIRTIKIGDWAEVDAFPGFYITFAEYNAQAQAAYHRRDQIFSLRCKFTCKGEDEKEALQELLELFGTFQKALEDDKVMRTTPADPVAETYHLEPVGFVMGTALGEGARSFEYIYGETMVVVKALLDAR